MPPIHRGECKNNRMKGRQIVQCSSSHDIPGCWVKDPVTGKQNCMVKCNLKPNKAYPGYCVNGVSCLYRHASKNNQNFGQNLGALAENFDLKIWGAQDQNFCGIYANSLFPSSPFPSPCRPVGASASAPPRPVPPNFSRCPLGFPPKFRSIFPPRANPNFKKNRENLAGPKL